MNKICTSLEQSKKLAEILSLESADMRYSPLGDNTHPWVWTDTFIEKDATPCWSLSALLDVLPKGTRLLKSATDDIYHCDCPKCNIDEWFDNPIDACVEMIIKLNELKIL